LLLASGLVTTTPTEQSPGDPQDVQHPTIAAGQMPKPGAAAIKKLRIMVLVMSMLSDSEFICTKCLVDFSYSLRFPNWNQWNTGKLGFEISSPHFGGVATAAFNDSQVLAHSKRDD
jgi:hypothetical protein